MSIQFLEESGTFLLTAPGISYAFQLYGGKYPVHLYCGAPLDAEALPAYACHYQSFSPYFAEYGMDYSPDTAMSEFSLFGSGDFRSAALKIRSAAGDSCTRFVYDGYEIRSGRAPLDGALPYGRPDSDTETLILKMKDDATGCRLELYYAVFPDCGVISRYFRLTNGGAAAIELEKAMSLCLDLPDARGWECCTLGGCYGWERTVMQRVPLFRGTQQYGSRRGSSSHHMNPFFAVCEKDADEETGRVYGFNFVYSGSYSNEIELDQNDCARILVGLGEENFRWRLESGESFCSPEAVMTYSEAGLGGMSRAFHRFVRNHISPAEKFPCRPVVVNTWEACYFGIDEEKLLDFARVAPECGVDMLVMDDGWFGKRFNDTAALGDWIPNADKFPDGLASFVRRVKENGIRFGIWIEPEMVNPDSDLYRMHPDWCLHCVGRESTLSRNQLMLDMANPAVVEYLKDAFARCFDGCEIDYFKWDMNRNLAEVGSPSLPPERQGEVSHRYMLGVYELFAWFGEHFPHAMIENCSGGGGRYDLGMMQYSTQIWASDNTWPQNRMRIQYGSSYAYPASVMSCHVSNPGNICADPVNLHFRWCTALGGMLGYEMHLPNASPEIRAAIREQVERYRVYEPIIRDGDLYRQVSPFDTPYSAYYFVSADRREILASFLDQSCGEGERLTLRYTGADENLLYEDVESGERVSGRQLREGISVYAEGKQYNGWVRLWRAV